MNKVVNQKIRYRLDKHKWVRVECYEVDTSLENWEIPTLYRFAYSRKQARTYFQIAIASYLHCSPYDVQIDISDIEEVL